MRRISLILCLFVLLSLALAACGGGAGDDTGAVIEDYIQALANKDEAAISTASCAEWEEMALLELDAFQAVETRLEGLSCSEVSREGDTAQVSCEGTLIATYNEEDQVFPLSGRIYQLEREDGEWRVCGYR